LRIGAGVNPFRELNPGIIFSSNLLSPKPQNNPLNHNNLFKPTLTKTSMATESPMIEEFPKEKVKVYRISVHSCGICKRRFSTIPLPGIDVVLCQKPEIAVEECYQRGVVKLDLPHGLVLGDFGQGSNSDIRHFENPVFVHLLESSRSTPHEDRYYFHPFLISREGHTLYLKSQPDGIEYTPRDIAHLLRADGEAFRTLNDIRILSEQEFNFLNNRRFEKSRLHFFDYVKSQIPFFPTDRVYRTCPALENIAALRAKTTI